jgi:hypothetical protein
MSRKVASGSRAVLISPAKGDEEVSAGLSAILGDLVLSEKEVMGLVAKSQEPVQIPKPRWVAVEKPLPPGSC